uniref:Uncharacterized protein n=1 Tax=Acrobeloides nanus TaxID=290746 RepID=A0A914C4G8_9BILA
MSSPKQLHDGDDQDLVEAGSSEETRIITHREEQDETNIKVDDEANSHNRRTARSWVLIAFEHLPHWLQDNEFLLNRHRPQLQSFRECIKSIFSIHTETGNIWSHLLGCVAFIILATWFLLRPGATIIIEEKVVFSFFFIGAILCLGISCLFHTLNCHSKPVAKIFHKLDYVGISLLIIGSFIPWIYYSFYCRLAPKIIHITTIGVLGILAIIVSLWDKFSEGRYRPLRAIIFVVMGLSAMVPAFHFLITDGFHKIVDEGSFYWLISMAFLYIFGAFIYAMRIPERFYPGKFDVWFQSHQLFHICVIIAAFVHYIGIAKMAELRLNNPC